METRELISKLNKFEQRATPAMFNKIFGKLGNHLWVKFDRNCNRRFMSFWYMLDTDMGDKLLKYLDVE